MGAYTFNGISIRAIKVPNPWSYTPLRKNNSTIRLATTLLAPLSVSYSLYINSIMFMDLFGCNHFISWHRMFVARAIDVKISTKDAEIYLYITFKTIPGITIKLYTYTQCSSSKCLGFVEIIHIFFGTCVYIGKIRIKRQEKKNRRRFIGAANLYLPVFCV